MDWKEIEAEALKLPWASRRLLASRLLDSVRDDPEAPGETGSDDDPIWNLGKNPVSGGVTDGSVNHDHYIYGTPRRDAPDDERPD